MTKEAEGEGNVHPLRFWGFLQQQDTERRPD
jgi:hypothetical protein